MTPEEIEFTTKVFAYETQKLAHLAKSNLKLAYYTSATTAAQALQHKSLWMRNATGMNDFLEIQHGHACLLTAIARHSDRFNNVIGGIDPQLPKKIATPLDGRLFAYLNLTYLTCVAEHKADDHVGRLSMWRAYGGETGGVALVFNPHFLEWETNDLAVWTSPVLYADAEKYERRFVEFLDSMDQSRDLIRRLNPDFVAETITNMLEFSILATKHPAFAEEREWRLIFQPAQHGSAMTSRFENVRGMPESIFVLPLEEKQARDGRPGYSLDALLHRVIVGPNANPMRTYLTMVDLLASLGVTNPGERVCVSPIPLRRSST